MKFEVIYNKDKNYKYSIDDMLYSSVKDLINQEEKEERRFKKEWRIEWWLSTKKTKRILNVRF